MYSSVFSWDNLPEGNIINGIEEKVIYLKRRTDVYNELTFRVEGLASQDEIEVRDESGLVFTPTRSFITLQPDGDASRSVEPLLAALLRGYVGESQEVNLTEQQMEQIGKNIRAAEVAVEAVELMRPLVEEHSQRLSPPSLNKVAIEEDPNIRL
jgi:hypothetical protein